jgi:hypothetical protein
MAPETLLLITVAAAFLLLGVVGSPLAWAALHLARKRHDQLDLERHAQFAGRLRALETQLARSAAMGTAEPGAETRSSAEPGRSGPSRTFRPHSAMYIDPDFAAKGSPLEPTLIAVPQLGAGPTDKETAASELSQRYAAIWALADNGAKADVIAHATGQPIGHIELILGLLRQIDGQRTTIPHASHI